MKRLLSHRIARAGLGLLLALVSVAPALAKAPDIVDQQFHRIAVFPCDGYDVIAEWDVSRRVITYYDQDDNPVEMKLIIHFVGALTNSASGRWLPDDGNFTATIDLATGTVTVAGGQRHTVEPGQGIVIQGTGRFVESVDALLFESGKWYSDADFCTALQ